MADKPVPDSSPVDNALQLANVSGGAAKPQPRRSAEYAHFTRLEPDQHLKNQEFFCGIARRM